MKAVHISDVHCKFDNIKIPECDLLISTGDYSFQGRPEEVTSFHEWLNKQPAKHIISVQGNHEKWVEANFDLAKMLAEEACPRVHFIDEGLVEIEGIKIWCSAVTPFFYNWAWNRYRGDEIQKHWDKIPNGVDIIATHGPSYGFVDGLPRYSVELGELGIEHLGCEQLIKKVLEIKPKYHLCGHIHGAAGIKIHEGITFINSSICNESYKPVNPPHVFEI